MCSFVDVVCSVGRFFGVGWLACVGSFVGCFVVDLIGFLVWLLVGVLVVRLVCCWVS